MYDIIMCDIANGVSDSEHDILCGMGDPDLLCEQHKCDYHWVEQCKW